MKIDWIRHCKSEEDKANYTASLKRAKWVLDDLSKLVQSNLNGREVAEISPKTYESPNWAYQQAHNNGYKQALKDVLNLINLDQENNGRQPT
jgi:hypothetical protein